MPFSIDDLRHYDSELLKLLTEHLPDMLWVKDKEGKYIYVNKALCDNLLMAKDVKEPIGKDDIFFAKREREAHKDNPQWHTFGELCLNSDLVVMQERRPMRFEEYGNVKGKMLYLEVFKAPFYDKDGNILGTVGAGRDITQLKQTQIKLEEERKRFEYLAKHDALTGLPNKTFLMEHIEKSISRLKSKNSRAALLFIDLDNFKQINDSFGHNTGDKVLMEFARRLSSLRKGNEILARIGGDEFCVWMEDLKDTEEIIHFIEDLKKLWKHSFWADGHEFYLNMSIGVSICPDDASTPIDLLKHADSAMYQAKERGRNKYFFYNKELTKKAYRYVMLEASLRNAIANNELRVYFQPQVDILKEQIIGVEALVRWEKDHKIISPATFISIAEKSNLIVELDRAVIEMAIEAFVPLKKRYSTLNTLSLNLSVKHMESLDFLEYIRSLKERYGDLSFIVFETTETLLMENLDRARAILEELNSYGISIAIDDFGTGFSSLSYLKNLPIDKIKIDKSFIDEIDKGNEEDLAITKSIIEIGENLRLDVIAEGVENKAQAKKLSELGCTKIQGYLYAKPMPHKQVQEFIAKWSPN